MATCTSCGNDTAEPQMVTYGDEAFANKPQEAFPVCPTCFERDEKLTVTRWEAPEDDPQNPVLVEFETIRYVKAGP